MFLLCEIYKILDDIENLNITVKTTIKYLVDGRFGSSSLDRRGKILTQIPPSSGASKSYCIPHCPSPILQKNMKKIKT